MNQNKFLRTNLVVSPLLAGFAAVLVLASATQLAGPADPEKLVVAKGLQATLWAESPMFYNPTCIDVDSKGRIWVAEAVNYRSFKNHSPGKLTHPDGDRVMILEDTDGDGIADKSKVFVQDKDLQAPVGIAVIGNKVVVSSAPSILVYTDEDGDDVADKKEVFLTGFGGYDHDHSLHSVIAGPDAEWYFNVGNAGPHNVKDKNGWELRSGSVYVGGTPYNKENKPAQVSDDGRIWTGGLALRVNPDGTGLKVMGHNFRNAYELTIDSFGNLWQNDNDDEVASCRTTWLMETGNAGFFSKDGTRTWRADQQPDQTIVTAHWHQEDPGVIPSGHITGSGAPTGVTIYEDNLLGPEYRGMVLSADAGRNVVFGFSPTVSGAGYDLSKRIDFVSSLGKSTEDYRWDELDGDKRKSFRPSDVAVGTDGAVYVADWYDPIVGGHAMHDTTGYGRIYRIAPEGKKLTSPKLNLETVDGQIQALLSPAINVRNLGFARLAESGEKVYPNVVRAFEKSQNPFHKARMVWLFPHLGTQGKAKTEALLKDKDEQIRLTAFRSLRSGTNDVVPLAQKLVNDKSPAVRREVALSLRDLPFAQCSTLLLTLADGYDGQDRWYLEALGSGMDRKENEIYPLLLEKYGKDPLKWNTKMANLAWRLHPEASIDAFEKRALDEKIPYDQQNQALTALAFIPQKAAAQAMKQVESTAQNKRIADKAAWWLSYRGGNDWAGFYEVKKQTEELSEDVKKWRQKINGADVPLQEQDEAAAALARDSKGAKLLFSLAAGKRLSPRLMDVIAANIYSNPDQSVRVLAGEYFPVSKTSGALSISDILNHQGNVANGAKMFSASCGSCHKMGAVSSADIGPDLTSIKNKLDRRALLDAIVHPDADVMFGYEPIMFTMKDGSTIYGFLQSDAEFVIVKDVTGKKITLTAKDIVSREKTRTLMPDPVTLGLKEQQLADIVAFLMK